MALKTLLTIIITTVRIKSNQLMRQTLYIFITFLSLTFSQAQEVRNDDLGDVSDKFQATFFEAIKQKGIENYDKAIDLLESCNTQLPNNAAINFELGKNYYELDKLELAENALQKANAIKPNNQWILETLYHLYRSQKNSIKTITTLKNLRNIHPKYTNELISVYYKTQQYDKALALINQLDKKGATRNREQLRHQIYIHGGLFVEQINYIEEKSLKNNTTEADYIKLIYAYSKLNNAKKSFEISEVFSKTYPSSATPHLTLYKFYMNAKKFEKATASMYKVLESSSLNDTDKYKVLNDFFNFTTKNNRYLPQLEEALKIFPSVSISSRMALFYSTTNNEKAAEYLESVTKNNATSFEDLKLLGTVFLRENKIEDALKNSKKALSLFPAQPIFYLQQAKAQNKKNQAKNAIESLEFGLDYLIDNPIMETDFYIEMAKGYGLLKDKKNQEKYLQKAKKLRK